MEPSVLEEIKRLEAEGDFGNPRYMELLFPDFYMKHICRLPEWPDPVSRAFARLNQEIYVIMQGPSEFGIAGRLEKWDRKEDLKNIAVTTLMIGSRHDLFPSNKLSRLFCFFSLRSCKFPKKDISIAKDWPLSSSGLLLPFSLFSYFSPLFPDTGSCSASTVSYRLR
jgi:hypothetical protein